MTNRDPKSLRVEIAQPEVRIAEINGERDRLSRHISELKAELSSLQTAEEQAIKGPLPPQVRAVLAQLLFVETAGLPSPLINQIKRLAAFQNPEFY